MMNPFFSTYDNNDRDGFSRYHQPSQSYRQRRRQEQAYQEELKRRQQAQASQSRRRAAAAEAARRHAYEQELARQMQQQQEEEALQVQRVEHERKERRRRLQAQQQESRRRSAGGGRHPEQQSYQIVRGRDGQLYRIPVEPEKPVVEVKLPTKQEPETPPYSIVRGRDGQLYKHQVRQNSAPAPEKNYAGETHKRGSIFEGSDPKTNASQVKTRIRQSVHNGGKENEPAAPKVKSKSGKKKQPRRRKVTVIVEDASDSEYEQDEREAMWSNRRPSPGKWMEPVESM